MGGRRMKEEEDKKTVCVSSHTFDKVLRTIAGLPCRLRKSLSIPNHSWPLVPNADQERPSMSV